MFIAFISMLAASVQPLEWLTGGEVVGGRVVVIGIVDVVLVVAGSAKQEIIFEPHLWET